MKNSSIGFTAILVLSLFIGVTLVTPDEQPPEVPPTPLHFDRYAFFAPAADSIIRPEKPLIKPDVLEFYWNTFVPVYLDHVTLPTTDVVLTSLGNYYITGYTSIECGGSTTTASGTTCHKAASYEDSFENPTTCAIDPALHDFSDVFFIEPFGYYIAEDTGSAVLSKHIDLFYGTTIEPVIVARKPCEGSCVDNVIQYGVGGINIDECRIGDEERTYGGMSLNKPEGAGVFRDDEWKPKEIEVTVNGRYPSNVILTYDDTDKDEVIGGMPCENGESAARFFYTAKASKRDRDEGLDQFEAEKVTDGNTRRNEETARIYGANSSLRRNIHPTVKPTDLMQYLVRLVTPKGGTVLDPFNGSGSTGKAVMYENRDRNAGYKYIGIELTAEYLPISNARIRYAAGDHAPNAPLNIADEPVKGQITFFDLLGGTE